MSAAGDPTKAKSTIPADEGIDDPRAPAAARDSNPASDDGSELDTPHEAWTAVIARREREAGLDSPILTCGAGPAPEKPHGAPRKTVLWASRPVAAPCSRIETEAERRERIAAVDTLIADTFAAAKFHLGEVEARKRFARLGKRARGNRGVGRKVAPDFILLSLFRSGPEGENVPDAAQRLYDGQNAGLYGSPGEAKLRLGLSKRAIEKRLRDLLKSPDQLANAESHLGCLRKLF